MFCNGWSDNTEGIGVYSNDRKRQATKERNRGKGDRLNAKMPQKGLKVTLLVGECKGFGSEARFWLVKKLFNTNQVSTTGMDSTGVFGAGFGVLVR